MKAIRFMDPGVIEYSEIPQPEIRDDEVLAQIAYANRRYDPYQKRQHQVPHHSRP